MSESDRFAPHDSGPGASPQSGDPEGTVPTSDDDGQPIGPFPTWTALYVTVLIYTAASVAVLYAFTVLFDRSAS